MRDYTSIAGHIQGSKKQVIVLAAGILL